MSQFAPLTKEERRQNHADASRLYRQRHKTKVAALANQYYHRNKEKIAAKRKTQRDKRRQDNQSAGKQLQGPIGKVGPL